MAEPMMSWRGVIAKKRRGYFDVERSGRQVPMPYVALDLAERPDVADLFRVAWQDLPRGESKDAPDSFTCFHVIGLGGKTHLIFTFHTVRPARCRFSVAFALEDHRDSLELMASTGFLAFVTTDDAGPGPYFSMEIPAAELRETLAAPW